MQFIAQTFEPAPALRPYVDFYLHETFDGSSQENSPNQYCLPHGTVELIFQIRQPSAFGWQNGHYQVFPDAFLVGVSKDTTVWKMAGKTEIFHVRLKPEGFIQLFHRPLGALFNKYVDVRDFLGQAGITLYERLQQAKDNPSRIAIMESFFKKQLRAKSNENAYFLEALQRIRQAADTLSIESLSKSLYVGERQLQRVFKEKLGVSPKLYHRIVRFSHAYETIQEGDFHNWADVALNHAYADQAHFIRDFKEFTGLTPGIMLQTLSCS